MDAPCKACTRGPTGFAGHDELTVNTIGNGRLTLRCVKCGSYWSRTPQEQSYFAWTGLTEGMAAGVEMGIAVPRSGASERRGLPWRGREPRRTAKGAR